MLRPSLLLPLFCLTLAACDSANPAEEQPPVTSREIEVLAPSDTTISIDAGPVVINLNDVFKHQGGEQVYVAAERSVTGTSAKVEGQYAHVEITPIHHGLSSMTFSAASSDGAHAEWTLRVHVEVPDHIEVLVEPDASIEIRSGNVTPYADFFRHAEHRALDFGIQVTGQHAVTATVVGDTAFVINGPHNATADVKLVAVDRGRETVLPLRAVVNSQWCPSPPPGWVSYLDLNEGEKLHFGLTKSNSSGGLYGSTSSSLNAEVTWSVSSTVCGPGTRSHTIRVTGNGTYKWSSTGYDPIERDSVWTNEFSFSILKDGSVTLTDFPTFNVFHPDTSPMVLELGERTSSNQADSESWNVTLHQTNGFILLKKGSYERQGASASSSSSFILERK